MRLRNLLHLYAQRTRAHPLQELLALVGIAIGVALVFAVLVANTSIAGSVRELAHGIGGDAALQLSARGPDGFGADVAQAVAQLPEVAASAPVVNARVELRGPRGSRTADLIGVDHAVGGGLLPRHAAMSRHELPHGLTLTAGTAAALGVRAGGRVLLSAGARMRSVPVSAVLGRDRLGSLADSAVALASLHHAQRLAGLQGRVTRVLVEPRPSRTTAVRERLERIAAGRLDVTSGDDEARLLHAAMRPNDQATALFASVSALVGLLLAFNAMLLTVPERRRFLADLRVDGLGDGTVVRLVVFDALVLGVVASAIGLLLGDLLSRSVFEAVPGYLALAFPVGEQRIVESRTVLVAVAGGLAATLLAALRPLGDLASRRPLDAAHREADDCEEPLLPGRALLAAAVAIAAAAAAVLLSEPAAAIVTFALLVVAMMLTIPAALTGTLWLLGRLGRRLRSPVLVVSLGELRSTPTRSLALAATGAIAVFGSVAVEGSHRDLQRGIDRDARGMSAQADLWVTPAGSGDVLLTAAFELPRRRLDVLAATPGVAAVLPYRAALLNVGGQRAWAIGPPAGGAAPLLATQLADPGQLAVATRRLRAGGWVALSRDLVGSLGLRVGDRVALPTPRPRPLRLGAVLTNIGWSGGGVVLNAEDFRRAWGSARVGALQVQLAAGASPSATAAALRRALPPASDLTVLSGGERARRMSAAAAQGLDRLTQIAGLVLIAGALALAAALGAAAWTRRPRLAALKMTGFSDGAVWRALLLESAIVLGVGCSLGVLFGLAGQFVLTYWLRAAIDFPVAYSAAGSLASTTFAGVTVVALAIAALPGWAAARVSPLAGVREE